MTVVLECNASGIYDMCQVINLHILQESCLHSGVKCIFYEEFEMTAMVTQKTMKHECSNGNMLDTTGTGRREVMHQLNTLTALAMLAMMQLVYEPQDDTLHTRKSMAMS